MIAALALAAALAACAREEKPEAEAAGKMVKCTFSTCVMESTKSTLNSEGMDSRITDLMVAVYRGDFL